MGYFLREKCVYLRDVGLNLFALTATRHRTRLPVSGMARLIFCICF